MCRHSSAHAVSINSLDDFALSQIFVHLSHAPFHLTRVCKRWHDMLYSNTRQSEALWHAMCCHRWRSFPPHLRLPSSPPTTTSSTSHFLPLSPLCQEHQVALDATHVQWVLDCSPSSTWRALFRKRHQQSLRYSNWLTQAARTYAQTKAQEDLLRLCSLSEVVKQASPFPRFWGEIEWHAVEKWATELMNKINNNNSNDTNNLNDSSTDALSKTGQRKRSKGKTNLQLGDQQALQFLLDSTLYCFLQHEVTLDRHIIDNVQERSATTVYGSVMSLVHGNTISFATFSHFIDNYQGSGDYISDNCLCMGAHCILLSERNVEKWVQWLTDVRQTLELPHTVSLLHLWLVLRLLLMPNSYCSDQHNRWDPYGMWWNDTEREFELQQQPATTQQQQRQSQPFRVSLLEYLQHYEEHPVQK